jgi:hypothetical protein
MKRRSLALSLVFAFILGVLFYSRLEAQKTNSGILVHPSNVEIALSPAESTQKEMYVENQTDKAITVGVTSRNFSASGEEGSVEFTNETNSFSLASWITTSPKSATIPPKSSQKFIVTITAPRNAEPGGHFASVIFGTVPGKVAGGTGAAIAQEVASLILARIPGEVKEDATVESFSTDKSFYEFGPVNFDTRVLKPAGEILLTDMFGRKISIPFNSNNVLPNAIRRMDTTWKSHFLIGKYTAKLIVSYGSKNQNLYASTEFYAFPVRFGGIALVVLILFFLIRRRLGKAIKALLKG